MPDALYHQLPMSPPVQVALAWLLAQHPFIVPTPRTRRRECLDENRGATSVAFSADEIADLNRLVERIGVVGNRYDDGGIAAGSL